MHQEIESEISPPDPIKQLIQERNQLMGSYRAATQHAVRALDYYQRFQRVEDWNEDETQDYIDVLKADSRRFLREIAIDVRRMRNRLDVINNKLMDLVKERQEKDAGKSERESGES